jgi:hypothetical protein
MIVGLAASGSRAVVRSTSGDGAGSGPSAEGRSSLVKPLGLAMRSPEQSGSSPDSMSSVTWSHSLLEPNVRKPAPSHHEGREACQSLGPLGILTTEGRRPRRTAPEASEEQGEADRRIEAEAAGNRIATGRRRSLVGREEGEEAGDACRQADERQGGLVHLLWA